jgi:hypothetical protein
MVVVSKVATVTVFDSDSRELGHGGCGRVGSTSKDMSVLVHVCSRCWGAMRQCACGGTYGMSEGVTGSEGGGGRLIRVGAFDMVGSLKGCWLLCI